MSDAHSFVDPWRGVRAELLPKIVALGAVGKDAQRVQEWLWMRGARIKVDGEYGPKTRDAVSAFQPTAGLPATGSVDEATHRALTAPLAQAFAPIAPEGRDLRAMIVACARQHFNERPCEAGGENRGPWVRAYMHGAEGDPWAWCAGFACAVMLQASEALGVTAPVVPSFGVPQMARSAKDKGRLVKGVFALGKILPGDLFIVPTTRGSWSHVGVVIDSVMDGTVVKVVTIEGNAGSDGNREGDAARTLRRMISKLDFIRMGDAAP